MLLCWQETKQDAALPKLSSAFSQAAPNGCSSTRGYFLFAQRHPGDIAVPWPGCTTHSPTPAQGLQGSLTGTAPAVHRSPFHRSVRTHSSWKRLFEAPVLNLTNAFHLPPLPSPKNCQSILRGAQGCYSASTAVLRNRFILVGVLLCFLLVMGFFCLFVLNPVALRAQDGWEGSALFCSQSASMKRWQRRGSAPLSTSLGTGAGGTSKDNNSRDYVFPREPPGKEKQTQPYSECLLSSFFWNSSKSDLDNLAPWLVNLCLNASPTNSSTRYWILTVFTSEYTARAFGDRMLYNTTLCHSATGTAEHPNTEENSSKVF